jgi:hypothetical protein
VSGPPQPPKEPPPEERESFGWKLLRSFIAPDVLEDGGRDAPLTRRGRILFWGTIAVLVIAVAILFAVTLANR